MQYSDSLTNAITLWKPFKSWRALENS